MCLRKYIYLSACIYMYNIKILDDYDNVKILRRYRTNLIFFIKKKGNFF